MAPLAAAQQMDRNACASRLTELINSITQSGVKNWPWQQIVRGLIPHLPKLQQVYLIHSLRWCRRIGQPSRFVL